MKLKDFLKRIFPLWIIKRVKDKCPGCGAKLEHKPGFYLDNNNIEHSYDGVVCPKGCDLFSILE